MTWLIMSISTLDVHHVPYKYLNYGHHKSRVMRKPAFCICENKDADQLRGNREADQRLSFRHTDFKPLAIFCGCTARFVWDLVGNPEDRFSQNEAHKMP